MPDLSTNYLGLNLKNPIVASASPLSKKVDTVKKLEDAGVSALVMYSLFEEQIVNESKALDFFLSHGTESFAEALTALGLMAPFFDRSAADIDQLIESAIDGYRAHLLRVSGQVRKALDETADPIPF